MFKTNFSEHNKIWGHKKDLGITASERPTVSAVLDRTDARKSSIGVFMFAQGVLDILKFYI